MRRTLPILLPLFALVLMGNSCDFAARTGSPPPPPPPPESGVPAGNGGLVVVVRVDDGTRANGAASPSAATAARDPEMVAAALSMSALSAPESEALVLPPEPIAFGHSVRRQPLIPASNSSSVQRAARPIPEPSAALLFATGLLAGMTLVSGQASKGRAMKAPSPRPLRKEA